MRKFNDDTELLSHLSAQLITGDKEELIHRACEKITGEPHRQHGFRTDYMFGYVAGALGKCVIVKHENAAGLLLSNETFKVPDYRLTLLDGTQFLVEVKNCNGLKISFKSDWLEKQKKYAELNKLSLKIAVYWRKIGEWTLIDASAFPTRNKKHILELGKAMMLNEMAMLGDVMLGTLLPLKLRIGFSKEHTRHVKGNEWHIVIESADVFCRDRQITDKAEKRIAFKIMLGGSLQEDTELILDNDSAPSANIYTYNKFEKAECNDQDFDLIGSLSRIISSSYLDATSRKEDGTRLIMPLQEPDDFSVFIPENYKSNALPLWRFILQPNKNTVL